MASKVVVEAEWDEDAQVWGIRSDDVPGLNIEADRYEAIKPKVVAAIADLAGLSDEIAALAGLPLEIIATERSRLAFA